MWTRDDEEKDGSDGWPGDFPEDPKPPGRTPAEERADRIIDLISAILADTPFRGLPELTPSLNKPCSCGSGMKYKKCCGKRHD